MNQTGSISVVPMLAALTLSCAAIIAVPRAEAEQTPPAKQNVTLVGCLVESQAVSGLLLLKNAAPKGSEGSGENYKVVSPTNDLDLTNKRNHRVEVTGVIEPTKTPASKVDDRLLPAFTVKTIADVSDTCPTEK